MKTLIRFVAILVITGSADLLRAQVGTLTSSNSTATPDLAASVSAPRTNTAIIPVPRPDERAKARTDEVLRRAREHPGECDIVFIGDSITHSWEREGKNVWEKYYGQRKCLNFGVGGDRTQHVLWRFEHGQLDGLKPKAAVLMIGTNNSNKEDNSESDILGGVQAIVKQIRERLPETKLVVLGIFPRGKTFSTQRGKILQVNQALAKLADDKMIHYVDFGSQLIEADGSISKTIMPDSLHLSERGYEIWARAVEPKLTELLR
jgi:lysophospholipase L1-like esterase